MHRLVEVSFADVSIGELFQFPCGIGVSALFMEKTGEYTYRFIEEPGVEYGMEGKLNSTVYQWKKQCTV